MKFQEFWKETTAAGADAPAGKLPPLPDGTHVGTVGHVSFRDVDWKKSSANPAGKCLNLRIDVHGHAAAWDDVPVQMRNIIEAICRSARVHLPSPDQDWDEQSLKGQTITIETISGISKAGLPYVRISKYRPSAAPLPKEITAAPTPRREKAPKVDLAPDDIPF